VTAPDRRETNEQGLAGIPGWANAQKRSQPRREGDCTAERLSDGRIVIKRADPYVRITAELLVEWQRPNEYVTVVDDVITLRADNRTVVYRLIPNDYDPRNDTYGAEWPD
jgi:hypothetical protein